MIVVFLASLVLIALCILWLPVWSVALLRQRQGEPLPWHSLRVVMPLQLLLALGLIGATVMLGLGNPVGCALAILVLISAMGAALVWRQRHRNV